MGEQDCFSVPQNGTLSFSKTQILSLTEDLLKVRDYMKGIDSKVNQTVICGTDHWKLAKVGRVNWKPIDHI